MKVSKKVAGKIDFFIEKVFLFGKVVSAIVLAAAVCIIVWSVFEIVSLPDSLVVPTYDQLRNQSQRTRQNGAGYASFLEQDSRRDVITAKYKNEILKILDYCYPNKDADESDYEAAKDVIVKWVIEYSETRVDEDFVGGLLKCLKSGYAECFNSAKTDEFDGVHLINEFHSAFDLAVARMQVSKQEAAHKRMNGWVVLGSATGSLIMFLIIPLLIKQEENTRTMCRLLAAGLFDEEGHGCYREILENCVANSDAIAKCCLLQTQIINLLEGMDGGDSNTEV